MSLPFILVIHHDPGSLSLFVAAGLALNLTPGPDMLYVAARASSEGRAAGVVSALGIAAGTVVHVALVAFGLAALLEAVPIALLLIRLAGAAYLVYLGVQSLRGQGAPRSVRPGPAPLGVIFGQGVVTNVLNPKVALFFLAFLPQFVDPGGNPALQVAALGLLFDTTGTLVNLAVAIGASSVAAGWRADSSAGAVLRRVTGVLLIALGLRLAFTSGR